VWDTNCNPYLEISIQCLGKLTVVGASYHSCSVKTEWIDGYKNRFQVRYTGQAGRQAGIHGTMGDLIRIGATTPTRGKGRRRNQLGFVKRRVLTFE